MILAASKLRESIHSSLNYPRASVIKTIHRFPRLEVDVGILRRPANHRMVGRQSTYPMLPDATLINHRANDFPRERFNLGDFMRCAKPVEKEQERDTRL